MKNKKTTFSFALIAGAALLAMPAASSMAQSAPAMTQTVAYETKAASYIESRLVDSRGATFRMAGQPYQVSAKLTNGQVYDCWAVDMKVRSDLSRTRGASSFTVLFHGDRAVALQRDLSTDIVRVDTGSRLAAATY